MTKDDPQYTCDKMMEAYRNMRDHEDAMRAMNDMARDGVAYVQTTLDAGGEIKREFLTREEVERSDDVDHADILQMIGEAIKRCQAEGHHKHYDLAEEAMNVVRPYLRKPACFAKCVKAAKNVMHHTDQSHPGSIVEAVLTAAGVAYVE